MDGAALCRPPGFPHTQLVYNPLYDLQEELGNQRSVVLALCRRFGLGASCEISCESPDGDRERTRARGC